MICIITFLAQNAVLWLCGNVDILPYFATDQNLYVSFMSLSDTPQSVQDSSENVTNLDMLLLHKLLAIRL